MVRLDFKILIFSTILILLFTLFPLDKVKAVIAECCPFPEPGYIGCNCHIGSIILCQATCPPGADNCGVYCNCGLFSNTCKVVSCSPSRCFDNNLWYDFKCVEVLNSTQATCASNSSRPCYDRYMQDIYGDYYYRCSGSCLQGWYVEEHCSNDQCVRDDEYWKDYINCGSGTSCGSNYCYNNDVYKTCTSDSCKVWNWNGRAYTSGGCGSDSERVKVQECGTSGWSNEYRCSGGNVQRKWIDRGCSGSSCYATGEWRDYQDCGDSTYTGNYRCSGNILQREYIERGCSNGSCYKNITWVDEEDCGSGYCDAWGSDYCLGDDIYHSRTCYDKGCLNGACYNTISTEDKLVQDCGEDEWLSEYRCSGNWSQQKKLVKTCSTGTCIESENWVNSLNCSESCFPGALNSGCRGGTYTCNTSTGKCDFPLQGCSPEQYTTVGTVCSCNNEKGAAIKECNGSGSCSAVEPYCDESCGADPVCQGLKPGDPYPGDDTKVCCKGEEAELHLPSWYEIAP